MRNSQCIIEIHNNIQFFNPLLQGLRRTKGLMNSPQLGPNFWVRGLPWGSYQLISSVRTFSFCILNSAFCIS